MGGGGPGWGSGHSVKAEIKQKIFYTPVNPSFTI